MVVVAASYHLASGAAWVKDGPPLRAMRMPCDYCACMRAHGCAAVCRAPIVNLLLSRQAICYI